MRGFLVYLSIVTILLACNLQFQAHGVPTSGPLIKHLSSLLKWTRSSTKSPQQEGNVLQFEDGYLVETVVEGKEIGMTPYKIRVSEDGELFAVDAINSNVMKITPPLSQYSRARFVAGSFQGYTGHIDGKPNESRFNHPKGITMDDKGNVYVADTLNHAIRKIGEAGVTTIAGGKANAAGYRDGPSEDATFSNDFDVVYIRPTCSLLVIDRGNAALRQISLNQDDCDYQSSSISPTDIFMVIVAVFVGYAVSIFQQGFGSSSPPKAIQQPSIVTYKEKPNSVVDSMKEEPEWPSFGQLIMDLCKLTVEAIGGICLYFVPRRPKSGLTPLKDRLKLPEDEPETPLVYRRSSTVPSSTETHHVHTPTKANDKYSEAKITKTKSASFRDPSLSGKHHTSSKRLEYSEYFGSGEVPTYSRSKTLKERTRHHTRDKNGDTTKPVEMNPRNDEDPKFYHNIRSKYALANNSYRF